MHHAADLAGVVQGQSQVVSSNKDSPNNNFPKLKKHIRQHCGINDKFGLINLEVLEIVLVWVINLNSLHVVFLFNLV